MELQPIIIGRAGHRRSHWTDRHGRRRPDDPIPDSHGSPAIRSRRHRPLPDDVHQVLWGLAASPPGRCQLPGGPASDHGQPSRSAFGSGGAEVPGGPFRGRDRRLLDTTAGRRPDPGRCSPHPPSALQRMDSWGGLAPSGRGLLVLVGLGAVIGALVGLTSVGSGTLFIVMMTTLMRMTMRNVVGTDVAHSAILTAGAGLLHLGFGNVDLALAGKYPYRFYTGGHHWESSHCADSGERTPNGGCPGADRSGA